MLKFIADSIYDTGIYEYGIINPREITFHEFVRDICKDNTCKQYNSTWVCPPAIGTLEECRNRCLQYDSMIVFSGLFFLDGSLDSAGIEKGMTDFKSIARKMGSLIGLLTDNYLLLSNEGCDLCTQCTYPDLPCRFPKKAYHSIEGYGLFIHDLAKKSNVEYNNGEGTVTFFGAALLNAHKNK